jgi:hypothetical protein
VPPPPSCKARGIGTSDARPRLGTGIIVTHSRPRICLAVSDEVDHMDSMLVYKSKDFPLLGLHHVPQAWWGARTYSP